MALSLFSKDRGTTAAQNISNGNDGSHFEQSIDELNNSTVAKLKQIGKNLNLDLKGARTKKQLIDMITNNTDQNHEVYGIHEQLNNQVAKIYEGLDKIRDLCPDLNLTLPQIIVIGDESTGKSSLIERIAMLPFFPRGNESNQRSICTRMPIQLRLHHLSSTECKHFANQHGLQYKQFGCWVRLMFEPVIGKPEVSPFFSKEEVEEKVKFYMQEIISSNSSTIGISKDCLVIEVFSDQIPNLTLVDLPGIVHVPRPNEPQNMPQLTEELTRHYMLQPHTLILVVLKANDAQRSSKALALVKELKKESNTLGILTMCDLVIGNQRLTKDFIQRLQDRAPDSISLQHGYVGVKNRDTRDQDGGVTSLEEAAAEELKWFEEHFDNLPPISCTTPVLLSRLVKMITTYVKLTWAPQTTTQIKQQKLLLEKQLNDFGSPDVTTLSSAGKQTLLKQLILLFQEQSKKIAFAIGDIKTESLIPYEKTAYDQEGMESWMKWKKAITMSVNACLEDTMNHLKQRYLTALQSSEKPLIASRFQNIHQRIGDYITKSMKDELPKLVARIQHAIDYIFIIGDADFLARRSILDKVKALVATYVFEDWILRMSNHISQASIRKYISDSSLNIDWLLNDSTQQKRDEIKARIDTLDVTLKEIDNLATLQPQSDIIHIT